jgi:hypothetical protein
MEKLKLRIFFVMSLVSQFFTSCETDEPARAISPDEAGYYLHDSGFLVFANNDVFERTAAMLLEKEDSAIEAWENGLNFISMRKRFVQGLELQAGFEKQYQHSGNTAEAFIGFAKLHANAFRTLDDGVMTTNIYRIDAAPLVNSDGIVKVGNVIFQYSYDYLKVIEDGDETKIQLLNEIVETDPNMNISVYKVERPGNKTGNARTTFYQKSSYTVVDESNTYCEWEARLTAELTLATVNVPIYETVCRTCYEETGKPYTCCESIYIRTDRRNYFEGFCYNEKERGLCASGGYGADARFQLMITGTYIHNGTSKSVYRISSTATSQLRHAIINNMNTPDADIVDAAITFKDVNNPKGKTVFIGFN